MNKTQSAKTQSAKRLSALLCLCGCLPLLPAQTRPLPPAVRSIKVRLQDYKGGPVQDATVQLLGVQRGIADFRRVSGFDPRTLTAKDFTSGFVRLADLPDGEFVLMAENPLFARSLSRPFTLPANEEAEVVVTLARGGVLEGRVVGPDQKPVAGAVVRTESGAPAHTGPLAALTASLFADTSTATSVTTAADGTFRLERLAHTSYRIVAEHADFVPAEVALEVTGDATVKLEPLRLADGVLVIGRVLRNGQGVPGAEVTFQFEDVSAAADPMRAMKVKTYKTKADGQGDFRLPARVPVGNGYVLMAAEPGLPLAQAAQLSGSRKRFDVKGSLREQPEVVVLPRQ